MRINNYNCNKNQASFGSKRIFPVVIRDMNNMPVKAWFSRLKLSDDADKIAMEKICEDWKGSPFLDNIYTSFKNGFPIHAVETDSRQIVSLANAEHTNNSFKLCYILTSPDSRFGSSNRKFKGVGEALMFGIVKTAKKTATIFKLISTTASRGFYEELKMVLRNGHKTFNSSEMSDFLKRQKTEWKALS